MHIGGNLYSVAMSDSTATRQGPKALPGAGHILRTPFMHIEINDWAVHEQGKLNLSPSES